MNPARHTKFTPNSSSACVSAPSNAGRSSKPLWSTTHVDMPAALARLRPAALRTLDTTSAISAGKERSAQPSIRAWRLVPRPDIKTPTDSVATLMPLLPALVTVKRKQRVGVRNTRQCRHPSRSRCICWPGYKHGTLLKHPSSKARTKFHNNQSLSVCNVRWPRLAP